MDRMNLLMGKPGRLSTAVDTLRFMDSEKDRDSKFSLKPLTPEQALRALLQVNPEGEPVEPDDGQSKAAEKKPS
jgi:hypothetical protein